MLNIFDSYVSIQNITSNFARSAVMLKVAVVTGSNKGLGFSMVKGLCRKYEGIVYLTSRDKKRGKEAIAELNKLGLYPEFHQLDVTDKVSIEKFRDHILEKHKGIDVLINNAAIAYAINQNSYEASKQVIDNNYKSILLMQEIIYPLVRNNGRILNISSVCGHLSNINNKYWIEKLSKKDVTLEDVNKFIDWFLESQKNGTFKNEDIADDAMLAEYRVSKVAVNALTEIQQKLFLSKNISINSLHPGVIRTDLTFGNGFFSADEAAETPIYLVLEAPQTLKGAFVWYDRRVVDWKDYKTDLSYRCASLFEKRTVLHKL